MAPLDRRIAIVLIEHALQRSAESRLHGNSSPARSIGITSSMFALV